MRAFADKVGMTAPYHSDIEKERHATPDNKLEAIESALILSPDERKAMYDLATLTHNDHPPSTSFAARRQGVATELKRMRKGLNGLKPGALVWDEPLFRIITEKFTIAMDGSVKVEFKNSI